MTTFFKFSIAAASAAALAALANCIKEPKAKEEPEVEVASRRLQCSFCPRSLKASKTPPGWTTFTSNGQPGKVCCGESTCKVAMAKHVASRLINQ